MSFKDHFLETAAGYVRFRPRYPEALFDYLAGEAPGRERAWDCATGSGQAAIGLARHFEQGIATDAGAGPGGSDLNFGEMFSGGRLRSATGSESRSGDAALQRRRCAPSPIMPSNTLISAGSRLGSSSGTWRRCVCWKRQAIYPKGGFERASSKTAGRSIPLHDGSGAGLGLGQ